MRVPASLKREHDELHTELDAISRLPGSTGRAARTVIRILQPHFVRENDYATPPLGLLPRLAQSEVTATMTEVLTLVARLKAELPLMLEEHRALAGALEELVDAARDEAHPGVARFAERLMLHARMEEVLYAAAILVGEYLRLALPSARASVSESPGG